MGMNRKEFEEKLNEILNLHSIYLSLERDDPYYGEKIKEKKAELLKWVDETRVQARLARALLEGPNYEEREAGRKYREEYYRAGGKVPNITGTKDQ